MFAVTGALTAIGGVVPAVVAIIAAVALTLAGCSATNPITTAESYNVVDGVPALFAGQIPVQKAIADYRIGGEQLFFPNHAGR